MSGFVSTRFALRRISGRSRLRRVAVVDRGPDLRQLQRPHRAQLVARERLRREQEQRGRLRRRERRLGGGDLIHERLPARRAGGEHHVAAAPGARRAPRAGAGTARRCRAAPAARRARREGRRGTAAAWARARAAPRRGRGSRPRRDRRSAGRGTPAPAPVQATGGTTSSGSAISAYGVRNPSRKQRAELAPVRDEQPDAHDRGRSPDVSDRAPRRAGARPRTPSRGTGPRTARRSTTPRGSTSAGS